MLWLTIVDVAAIYFTQKSCSGHFRNGLSLTQLVEGLHDGSFHPLQNDFLILNVVQAEVRLRKGPRAPILSRISKAIE